MKTVAKRVIFILVATLLTVIAIMQFHKHKRPTTYPVYIDTTYYDSHEPQHGDVVGIEIEVGNDPKLLKIVESLSKKYGKNTNAEKTNLTLKQIRIIAGCGGDIVEIRAGVLYVNNQPLKIGKDNFSLDPVPSSIKGNSSENWGPIKVPDGHFFVINDSLSSHVIDSRYYGCISREAIKGGTWMQPRKIIEGERVNVRPSTPDDIKYMLQLRNEYQSDNEKTSIADIQQWYDEILKDPTKGWFIITTKAGSPIGEIGYAHQDANRADIPIIRLGKEHQNKGYGTDAMKVFSAFLFSELGISKIFLFVRSENERAIRCFEKSGFKREAVRKSIDGQYEIIIMVLEN